MAPMDQRLSLILLILCTGAGASAGQDLPVDTAALGIKELAYEVPRDSSITTSAGPGMTWSRGMEDDSDIFVIDSQSSKPRKLVGGGARPAWSPDGSKLAYCTWKGTSYGQIEVVNADGTGKQQITNMKGGACYPDWSPDGSKIVFTALKLDDSEKKLYGTNNSEIFVVDKNGGDPVPVAPGYAARWSPGGTMLIIQRAPEKKGPSTSSVWLATADGKQSRALVAVNSAILGASWFPNARSIAVSTFRDLKYRIFRVYLDASQPQAAQPQVIVGDDQANWTEPSVSPDAKQLIAVKDYAVMLLDLDTNKSQTLARGSQYSVVWERK